MADKKKVIKGFECCDDTNLETLRCEECPYRETDTCSAIAKLHKDALEILKTVGGWIDVKDRLPNKKWRDCLVATKTHDGTMSVNIAWLRSDDGQWASNDEWICDGSKVITHWMPLPELPEEVSGDD